MKGLVKRGEIWEIDLGDGFGSEQHGKRPCLVIQNDIGNAHSTTTIVCPISSKINKCRALHPSISGLPLPSVVLCEQIRVVDSSRFIHKMGNISKEELMTVNRCIRKELSLD